MSKRPQLIPHFATAQEQSTFLRWMRLLRDDVSELSGSIGILVALSKRSEDHGLISVLNRNPAFWNSILDALNTSSFVVMGRIHDTTGDAYLKNVMRFLKTRKALSGIARHFGGFAATHGTLIIKVRKLRHNVFAHIAVTRPEFIAFDFEGLTWDQLEVYWRDLAITTARLERCVFGGDDYGPQLNANMLDDDIERANQALDLLLVPS